MWELRLYVAGKTARSVAAFENLRRVCEEHLRNMRAQMTGGGTGLMLSFDERWEDNRLYFEGGTFGQTI
jgi:hypothetical protein